MNNVWGPLESAGDDDYLVSATETRYRLHFSGKKDRSAFSHWLRHNIYIAKVAEFLWASLTQRSLLQKENAVPPYTIDAISSIFAAVHGKARLILVPQKDEVGLRTRNRRSRLARKALSSLGISWSDCPLAQGDYMKFDSHPNAAGYQKIRLCAQHAIRQLLEEPEEDVYFKSAFLISHTDNQKTHEKYMSRLTAN